MRKLLENATRTLIGGHRGCICGHVENSIPAMAEAIRQGADYLEIDVQLTKDDIPVIFHDTIFRKNASVMHYIHEMEYSRLREAVPELCTFSEAMQWGKEQGVYFALELKSVPLDTQPVNMRLTERMIPILKEWDMTKQVYVFGIDYMVLKHLKSSCPEVEIGLIVPHVPADPVALMKEMNAMVYLSYVYQMTPEIIKMLQSSGYYVSGAILREEGWVEKAFSLQVNMFESDEPSVVISQYS